MSQTIEIEGRRIGEGEPCYLIAEVGTTSMGDLGRAMRLVEAAAEAGMDAVKFQVIDPYQDVDAGAEYRVVWDGVERTVNMREMFERLVMSETDWRKVASHARGLGITFLATCDYVEGIALLERVGLPAHKIGAWDTTYKDLVEAAGRTGKPLFVDLGPTTEPELADLAHWYATAGGPALIPLHDYHTDVHAQMNMHAITHLRRSMPGPVGYSSPNTDDALDFAAVALGAQVIEKRLILSRSDHVFHAHESLEPAELASWVKAIRAAEAAMGRAAILPSDADLAGARKYYRSIVAARDIAAGATLTREDLAFKRPGTGLPPREASRIVGRRAARFLPADTLLDDEDLR